MDALVAALTAFALIVPIELPDKTFIATLVLATKYRPGPVWLGVVSAFGVQCAVAVAAGRLLALLPEDPVKLVAGVLFTIGSVVLIRGARNVDAEEKEREDEYAAKVGGNGGKTGLQAAMASFLVLFVAEWGDLSQLLTAGLVVRGGHPVAVFFGSWLGLALVSGLAVVLGRVLLRYVRLSVIRYVGGAVCAILAAWTFISVAT
jgi:putative Ca2+/H+ antiporter (TMEM165/GDT1 family)